MKSSPRQDGFTLIELLVSIALGIVVVGTVVALFVSSSSARTQSQALAEMNEDGLYALRLISQQVRLAGFNPMQATRPNATPTNPMPGGAAALPIFGCDGAFANGTNSGPGYSGTASYLLTCDPANTASHSISVVYEADIYNTIPTGGGLPTDCLGNALTVRNDPAWATASFYVAENRFYVANNALFCAGSGGAGTTAFTASPQPLVSNVEQIFFQYGVMPAAATNTSTIAAGYLTASELGNASGFDLTAHASLNALSAPQRWAKVTSVRICVLMRSSAQVLSQPQVYVPCDPAADVVTPTDLFARRAYISTVNLRNSRP